MVPDIITDFYPQVIQGMELVAKDFGLSVIIVSTNSKKEAEMELLKNRLGKMVADHQAKQYHNQNRSSFFPHRRPVNGKVRNQKGK